MNYIDRDALDAALVHIRAAPTDGGVLRGIVRRPAFGERDVLIAGELDPEAGLVGDTWVDRGSRRTDDGSSHPDMQLNIMNARAAEAISASASPADWSMAGDQLYVDLDLSDENLPPGTQLALGTAVIEVTDQPHTGCVKFRQRFGPDALRWVNSPDGTLLHLRGINARVVRAGTITCGDTVTKRR